jgi:hypothetical protein
MALRRLHELDAQEGGATVYQMAVGMQWLLETSHFAGTFATVARRLFPVPA